MTARFLVVLMAFSLFLIPSSFALAEGLIFYNGFEDNSDFPLNATIGTITEFELGAGGEVNQSQGYLNIFDDDTNEYGFRTEFTERVTEDFFVQFRARILQTGGFGGFAADNCTTQHGLDVAGTCPEGGQEVWDNNFVKWAGGNVQVYSNTGGCAFTANVWHDYAIVHNFTTNTAQVWQDGVVCASKAVDAGQEMESVAGMMMQSGGSQIGTYQYDHICAYPASAGEFDLNCTQLPVRLANSSWDVTSGNVIGDTDVWNTGGIVEINTDVLSFTVLTNVTSNMSCSTTNTNYSEMILLNANYKAATTNTTSHATTLFDNLANGSNSVFCDWVRTDGGTETPHTSALSGALRVTLTPIIPPTPLPFQNILEIVAMIGLLIIIIGLALRRTGK